ncbi:hypothetical protein Mapa_012656 [Marchantia paleacea]|nr:hypothetical protein Mapa_012656 [Marchantia paleacea]
MEELLYSLMAFLMYCFSLVFNKNLWPKLELNQTVSCTNLWVTYLFVVFIMSRTTTRQSAKT